MAHKWKINRITTIVCKFLQKLKKCYDVIHTESAMNSHTLPIREKGMFVGHCYNDHA